MGKWIDADALKKDIARLHVLNDEAEIRRAYEYNPHATSTDFEETLVSVFDAIDDAPSIEPKRGEWEDIDNWWESNEEIHLFRCSVCGAEMNSPIEPNFCCSCGADMRKETVDYKRVVLTCDDEGNWSMCGERKEGE